MDSEQIISFIKQLIPEELIIEKQDYYLLPTICHNEDPHHASHKLYLYKNPESVPLFTCYTECSDTFNIYTLIQKYYELRGEKLSYRDAYKKLHGEDFVVSDSYDEKEIKYETKFVNPLDVKLDAYNPSVLESFYISELDPWALEGIDLDILKKFKVGYSKSYEGVTIPHFDWRGNMVGLRIRTYNPNKEAYAKYMPMQIGNILYRHPLSLNLYGIFENQNNIQESKTVILAESEKSVLQWDTMTNSPNITLAVCGQNISKWQMDMLIYFLGVEKVIIAFDKEYKTYTEAFNYVNKIKEKISFLLNFADVYVMIDEDNIFHQKESPFDRTIRDFYKMKQWKLS